MPKVSTPCQACGAPAYGGMRWCADCVGKALDAAVAARPVAPIQAPYPSQRKRARQPRRPAPSRAGLTYYLPWSPIAVALNEGPEKRP
jgi:hypothetical protein